MSDHPYTTIICTTCGHSLRVPVYCKNRFCPVCSGGRQRRIRKKLQYYAGNCSLQPGQRLKHVVLTVKSGQDLKSTVALLVNSFRKLRQRKWWKRHVSGGAYVIEITKSDAGWHPHIHAIVQSWFMPYAQFKAEWEKVSGAWSVSVCERPAYVIANYITDYITKLPKDISDSKPMSDALGNRRLYSVFGTWHAMKVPSFRVSYPCPKCQSTFWQPLDCLFHNIERSPPVFKNDVQPLKSARP